MFHYIWLFASTLAFRILRIAFEICTELCGDETRAFPLWMLQSILTALAPVCTNPKSKWISVLFWLDLIYNLRKYFYSTTQRQDHSLWFVQLLYYFSCTVESLSFCLIFCLICEHKHFVRTILCLFTPLAIFTFEMRSSCL